jgi:uncharacterized protein (TIGR02588 family)
VAKSKQKPPLLEWIASAIGLLLILGVMAVIARDAFNGSADMAPEVTVTATRVRQSGAGYLVEFEARNVSPVTAAQLVVEGKLPGGETSTATIDYVPGRSARRGGLFFSAEPNGVALRALGYQDP